MEEAICVLRRGPPKLPEIPPCDVHRNVGNQESCKRCRSKSEQAYQRSGYGFCPADLEYNRAEQILSQWQYQEATRPLEELQGEGAQSRPREEPLGEEAQSQPHEELSGVEEASRPHEEPQREEQRSEPQRAAPTDYRPWLQQELLKLAARTDCPPIVLERLDSQVLKECFSDPPIERRARTLWVLPGHVGFERESGVLLPRGPAVPDMPFAENGRLLASSWRDRHDQDRRFENPDFAWNF